MPKYWFYSEGNILGPYGLDELFGLPAFGQGSLVCPEHCTGENPGDWKTADSVPEIAEAVSVGVGGVITSRYSAVFSPPVTYYESQSQQPDYSYEELLDTIDKILGTRTEESSGKPHKSSETDYDVIDKFEIRLSKIQEELEAARWEKNILVEKIRLKEMEQDKKQRQILELEDQLKTALEKLQKYEGGGQTAPSPEAAKPRTEFQKPEEFEASKTDIKSAKVTEKPLPERKEEQDSETGAISSGKLRSLGFTKPKKFFEDEEDISKAGEDAVQEKVLQKDLPGSFAPETPAPAQTGFGGQAAPAPGLSGAQTEKTPDTGKEPPQDMQSTGVIYDFTVIAERPTIFDEKREKVKMTIETEKPSQPAPAAPPHGGEKAVPPDTNHVGVGAVSPPFLKPSEGGRIQPAVWGAAPTSVGGQAKPAELKTPAFTPAQSIGGQAVSEQTLPTMEATEKTKEADAKQAPVAPHTASMPPVAVAEKQDKTERITVSPPKKKEEKTSQAKSPDKKKKMRMTFIATIVVFGAIAAGSLSYFFLGEGVSLSEFSLINFSKKSKESPDGVKEKSVETKAPETAASGQEVSNVPPSPSSHGSQQTPTSSPAAFETASNENIKKVLDIVKNYKLGGGRGTVSNWFGNSFLSGSQSGMNEEWTATILHGNVFVVQYRLLRSKQDPLVYQFEVDIDKNTIVRGINNNAIELLDFPSTAPVVNKKSQEKAVKKPKPKKNTGQVPLLPLPDEPKQEETTLGEPTGFENIPVDSEEKVKYIVAQETDEELF
ncbi:MAG: hypothetical protein HY746_07185 [Elusimicrobia bacterium]|nr:hypothetical protein [Elusimicrobiota bacterium]